MKVLLTGAQGYIGARLGPLLIVRGHETVGLDTGYYIDGLLYDERPTPECVAKDIRHVTVQDLQGIDAVVHLAELSNDPLGHLKPEVTYDINHAGSVRLAQACKKAGVRRYVYASSCSVYGIGSEEYKTEASDPNPQTPYASCKVRVERDVSAMADDNFSPTFLRNATAYGPSPRMRFDIVLNNLAGWAWTTGRIVMTSDGTPWRPLVHVRDICEAMACVLEAPRAAIHNEIFNVGANRENYRVRDIAAIVADAFPGCVVSLGESGGDTRSYRVSFDKINTRLPGFRCARDAVSGAGELRQLFESINLTREDFEFRAFTRVKQLKHLLGEGAIDHHFLWTGAGRRREPVALRSPHQEIAR